MHTSEIGESIDFALPFYPQLVSLPKILKPFDVNVVFKYRTLKNILIRNSPVDKNGCIYEIPCSVCNKKYLGQSGKNISTRLKQHQYNVRTGNLSSSLFQHMNNHNHAIDWQGARVVMYCSNILKRNY